MESPGDGLSSVVVGEHVPAADGEAFASDPGAEWQSPAACEPETCPPWNGVPGIINRHLGNACPRIVFAADALMLWQGNIQSRPLFIDPATNLSALDIAQVDAPVSAGPRLDLILNVNECHGIQANWFNVQNFSGYHDMPQGQSQYAMNNLAGMTFADIDTAFVNTTAAFKSFELNWRRRTCSPLTWLAGFRWVEWDQSLEIVDTYTDIAAASGVDSMTVLTGNNLYGGQIGLDALLWNTGRWLTFNGIAKAGVFYNRQAFQRTSQLGDRVLGDFEAVGDGTAFVGEVGVNGTVQITPWLFWRAGYNFFWLVGMATPAQQLSVTNQPDPPTTALNLDNAVLLHGVNTGFEVRW